MVGDYKKKGKRNNVEWQISCYEPYVSAAVTRMVEELGEDD